MPQSVSDSRFHMWRALFAMAHADNIVTSEEKRFMYSVLAEHPFSEVQVAVLKDDIETAHDIGKMFSRITDQHDRTEFFRHARTLVWCDGDFAQQEQRILTELQKSHYASFDFNSDEATDLTLDDDDRVKISTTRAAIEQKAPGQGVLSKLMSLFQ